MSNVQTVSVLILDKEFRLSCTEETVQELRDAAHFLDSRMREIRKSGRVIGMDRIAVMAALKMAHELLALHHQIEEGVITSKAPEIDSKSNKGAYNNNNFSTNKEIIG